MGIIVKNYTGSCVGCNRSFYIKLPLRNFIYSLIRTALNSVITIVIITVNTNILTSTVIQLPQSITDIVRNLSYIKISQPEKLPTVSGLYFVCLREKSKHEITLVYVGQSLNIRQRWKRGHVVTTKCMKYRYDQLPRVHFLPILGATKNELIGYENTCIDRLSPTENIVKKSPLVSLVEFEEQSFEELHGIRNENSDRAYVEKVTKSFYARQRRRTYDSLTESKKLSVNTCVSA